MTIFKKSILLSLITLALITNCSCKDIKNYLSTEIAFGRDNVFLLTNQYLAEITETSVNIYNIDYKGEEIKLYDNIAGRYQVADFADSLLLLQKADSLLCYNLDTKESIDYYSSIFSETEINTAFKYQAFFINNAKSVVVTKIIYDIGKPIFTNSVQTGYSVSENSGVYIYNISSKKPVIESTVSLDKFDIEISSDQEIGFTAAKTGEISISLSVKVYPATIPFYTEYFYKVNTQNVTVKKLGESSFEESQDYALQYSYLENRIIKADSKQLICVDFENEKIHKFKLDEIDGINSVDILETENKNFFFVNIGTNSANYVYKFKIVDGVLNCEAGEEAMLSVENLFQNSFARGNKLFFPADKQARRYGTLLVNGTAYRSYSNNGYLCESDGKTVLLAE